MLRTKVPKFLSKFSHSTPLVLLNAHFRDNFNCQSFSSGSSKPAENPDYTSMLNKWDDSLSSTSCGHLQYPANYPIEDRFFYDKFKFPSGNGFICGVFDGHAGWQFADYINREIYDRFVKEFNGRYNPQKQKSMQDVLEATFDIMETEVYNISKTMYDAGFGSVRNIGTCAIVAVITDNTLTVANSGDCRAVICSHQGDQLMAKEMSYSYSANNIEEQQRYKSEYPDESDVVFERSPGDFYIKNRRQPTKAFGNFEMKSVDFNNPRNLSSEFGLGPIIPNWSGNYITYKPELRQHSITSEDRYLIMATDGIWDEMTPEDATAIVAKCNGDVNKATEDLKIAALEHAAELEGISYDQLVATNLEDAKPKTRRDMHDDITVVVVDLHKLQDN